MTKPTDKVKVRKVYGVYYIVKGKEEEVVRQLMERGGDFCIESRIPETMYRVEHLPETGTPVYTVQKGCLRYKLTVLTPNLGLFKGHLDEVKGELRHEQDEETSAATDRYHRLDGIHEL